MVDQDEREVFRRHGAEGVLLLGGGAAILLQLADPRVARGVARHSGFRERPLDRLFGTLDYVYAVGFGDDELAAAAVRAVNAATCRCEAPPTADGRRTAPSTPTRSAGSRRRCSAVALDLHERLWGPLDEPTGRRDRARVRADRASDLQATREGWPETRAEFERWWSDALARLEVGDEARSVARALLSKRGGPPDRSHGPARRRCGS